MMMVCNYINYTFMLIVQKTNRIGNEKETNDS